jgi:hypothetical protein
VKRISHKQSRRNRAKRQRKVARRHAQAGHWKAQSRPMFTSGTIHYEMGSNTDAMSFGGIGAVHRLTTKLGLAKAIDERLELLKVHLPYHESDHVLNLAYNVLCGGKRLDDIEGLRHDTAYMNALGADLIPDPTTAGDFCRRFGEEDLVTLMEAVNAVRPKLGGAGPGAAGAHDLSRHPWDPGADVRREEGRHGHLLQGGLGLCAPDPIPGQHQGSALSGQPPGQSAQSYGCGPVDRQGPGPGGTPYRGDLPEGLKERGYLNLKLHHEDVAEFGYKPGKCKRFYRVVVVRKNISRMKGENALFDEIRYLFYITTRTDLSPADVVRCANQRCDQENVIEQLKNGVNALRVPLYDLVSNWAYMVMATLAWNLKSWFAMMMHLKKDRRHYIAMEFPRFLHSVILLPCRVIRRARTITLRILGSRPTLDRLFSAWRTIERTGFT